MLNEIPKLLELETLTEWEKSFLTDIQKRADERGDSFKLSEKQTAVIQKIQKDRSAK